MMQRRCGDFNSVKPSLRVLRSAKIGSKGKPSPSMEEKRRSVSSRRCEMGKGWKASWTFSLFLRRFSAS